MSAPKRLAPAGAGVKIRWEKHAAQRTLQRVLSLGLSVLTVEALIRNPLGDRPDEPDPDRPGRIRRWSLTPPCNDLRVHLLIFVMRELVGRTSDTPGEVVMITVMDRGPTT